MIIYMAIAVFNGTSIIFYEYQISNLDCILRFLKHCAIHLTNILAPNIDYAKEKMKCHLSVRGIAVPPCPESKFLSIWILITQAGILPPEKSTVPNGKNHHAEGVSGERVLRMRDVPGVAIRGLEGMYKPEEGRGASLPGAKPAEQQAPLRLAGRPVLEHGSLALYTSGPRLASQPFAQMQKAPCQEPSSPSWPAELKNQYFLLNMQDA